MFLGMEQAKGAKYLGETQVFQAPNATTRRPDLSAGEIPT